MTFRIWDVSAGSTTRCRGQYFARGLRVERACFFWY